MANYTGYYSKIHNCVFRNYNDLCTICEKENLELKENDFEEIKIPNNADEIFILGLSSPYYEDSFIDVYITEKEANNYKLKFQKEHTSGGQKFYVNRYDVIKNVTQYFTGKKPGTKKKFNLKNIKCCNCCNITKYDFDEENDEYSILLDELANTKMKIVFSLTDECFFLRCDNGSYSFAEKDIKYCPVCGQSLEKIIELAKN